MVSKVVIELEADNPICNIKLNATINPLLIIANIFTPLNF